MGRVRAPEISGRADAVGRSQGCSSCPERTLSPATDCRVRVLSLVSRPERTLSPVTECRVRVLGLLVPPRTVRVLFLVSRPTKALPTLALHRTHCRVVPFTVLDTRSGSLGWGG